MEKKKEIHQDHIHQFIVDIVRKEVIEKENITMLINMEILQEINHQLKRKYIQK